MTQKRRKADSGKAIGETTALRWEPTHVTKPNPRVVPLQSPSLSTPCVDLFNKLDRDSKLNGNEHKYCIDNNLCLYCGSKDHKVNGCPRKQPSRVRLTTLEEQETLPSENLLEN